MYSEHGRVPTDQDAEPTPNFNEALGRVVTTSAALEGIVGILLMHAMSDNVGRAALVIAPQPYKWLSTSLRMIAMGSMKPHPLQTMLTDVLKTADEAMQRRNAVVHGVQRDGHVANLRRSKGGVLQFEKNALPVEDLVALAEDLAAARTRLMGLIPALVVSRFLYRDPLATGKPSAPEEGAS